MESCYCSHDLYVIHRITITLCKHSTGQDHKRAICVFGSMENAQIPHASSRDLEYGLSNLQATKPLPSGPNSIVSFNSTTAVSTLLILLAHISANANLGGRVGVHLPLSTSHRDVHESSSVCYSLLRAALGGLLLLLRLNLWCLRLDLSSTSERSVHFTHDYGSLERLVGFDAVSGECV